MPGPVWTISSKLALRSLDVGIVFTLDSLIQASASTQESYLDARREITAELLPHTVCLRLDNVETEASQAPEDFYLELHAQFHSAVAPVSEEHFARLF